jgi:hypothetical protein
MAPCHGHRTTLRGTRQQGPRNGLIPGNGGVSWSSPSYRRSLDLLSPRDAVPGVMFRGK